MTRIGLLACAILISVTVPSGAHAQSQRNLRASPGALVADLYKAHRRKRSPFFQTRSRALLYKYFEKSLADMIWKDAVSSKGEVGAIDGDPLYDAQDMEIKSFAIGKATYDQGKAKVARNGRKRQQGLVSVRRLKAELGGLRSLLAEMKEARRLAGGATG